MLFAEATWTSVLFIALVGVTSAMVCLAADPALPDGHMLIKFFRFRKKYAKAGGGVLLAKFSGLLFGGKSQFECPRGGILIVLYEVRIGY